MRRSGRRNAMRWRDETLAAHRTGGTHIHAYSGYSLGGNQYPAEQKTFRNSRCLQALIIRPQLANPKFPWTATVTQYVSAHAITMPTRDGGDNAEASADASAAPPELEQTRFVWFFFPVRAETKTPLMIYMHGSWIDPSDRTVCADRYVFVACLRFIQRISDPLDLQLVRTIAVS